MERRSSNAKGGERMSLRPHWTTKGMTRKRGAQTCFMHCVRERQSAYRSPYPEPFAFDWTSALAPG